MKKIVLIALIMFVAGVAGVSPGVDKHYHQSRVQSSSIVPNSLQLEKFALNDVHISKGMFLIARPNLPDPHFAETVVLLIDYSPNGAVGLIVNRSSDVRLKKVLPDVKGARVRNKKIFLGGPVAVNQLFFLVYSERQPEESIQLLEKVYILQKPETIDQILTKKDKKMRLRVYVGYAGWAIGQLEYEISRGDWNLMPADAESIFIKEPKDVWPELVHRGPAQMVKAAAYWRTHNCLYCEEYNED
jgi:putative transcriptional regulator